MFYHYTVTFLLTSKVYPRNDLKSFMSHLVTLMELAPWEWSHIFVNLLRIMFRMFITHSAYTNQAIAFTVWILARSDVY